ncbi:hypothetical protein [Sulfitobacter donghicola]|uniref:Uncharacterized protein n=1 Tax=Sulfitobacter donghicola DSW-25 = KCTC 12864 = JCM 14565 TaxID=1300350 RepID=A0A073J089_9RHOB|nr:hypothetical protein [Sulfitobacter donghicola]KEJ91052.1 hypothetical protein DSW25_01075 [Sulfitobacter donghicola DSW-25 = KCTC 12864 = JCM 14565]KIN67782.1 ABC transporter, ATP-binding [Sulfitobacter donghicola DSW-25 = KCTC 12864 = JCM 14565]
MSSIAHRYTSFSSFDQGGAQVSEVAIEKMEEDKLQAYEEGYQAGWTDAETNQNSEQKAIRNEVLQAIRDLSFTQNDAISQVQKDLAALFEQLTAKLLPETIDAVLRAHVIEQLTELSSKQIRSPFTLRTSPANQMALQELLNEAEEDLSVALIADDTLSTHQLFVSHDVIEREINLDSVCQEIVAAMNAFNFHSQ